MHIRHETLRMGPIYLTRRRHVEHTARVLAERPGYLIAEQEKRIAEMSPLHLSLLERVIGWVLVWAMIAVFLVLLIVAGLFVRVSTTRIITLRAVPE